MIKIPLGKIPLEYHRRSYYIKVLKYRFPFTGIEKGRTFILKLLSRNRIFIEPLNPEHIEHIATAIIKQGKIVGVRKVGIIGRDPVLCIPMLMVKKLKMEDGDFFNFYWLGGHRSLLKKIILKIEY